MREGWTRTGRLPTAGNARAGVYCGSLQRAGISRRTGRSPSQAGLLDFDVIACVDLVQAEGDQHARRVRRRAYHDSLSDDFAGRVVPSIFRGHAAVTEHEKGSALRLISSFVLGALIAENAEIIADLHALSGSEVDVDDVVGAVENREMLAGDNHRDRLAAGRREAIKVSFGLQRWRGALLERQHDIAALDVVAGIHDLGDGDIGLHDDDAEAAFVFPHRADFLQDRELPLGPLNLGGIRDRANHRKLVADLDALACALVDVNVVALREGGLEIGLFAGDHVRILRDGLARNGARAVDVVLSGGKASFLRSKDAP